MKVGNFDMVVDEVDSSRGVAWGRVGNVCAPVFFGSWRPSRRVRSGDVIACFSRGYGEYYAFGFSTSDGAEV